MSTSCPILKYNTTYEAIDVATQWAKESGRVAIVYSTGDGFKIGWLQKMEERLGGLKPGPLSGDRYLNDDGHEIWSHCVSYEVHPCGSVWDKRMKIGVGPKFNQ